MCGRGCRARLPPRRRHLTEHAVLLLRLLLLCMLRRRRRLSLIGQSVLLLLVVRRCRAEEAVTLRTRRELRRPGPVPHVRAARLLCRAGFEPRPLRPRRRRVLRARDLISQGKTVLRWRMGCAKGLAPTNKADKGAARPELLLLWRRRRVRCLFAPAIHR